MNDVADGLLLDVREISIAELEFTDEESALNRALRRILLSNAECEFSSFNNSI
jgi:hypothetical protein